MQQKLASEDLEFCLHQEEHEELRREFKEEWRELVEECHRRDKERYEVRWRCDEELLQFRMKESQQQQQMTRMMQFIMTAMKAYVGLKPPEPDNK